MQSARRFLLRAVGQRVNPAQPPGCALAAPGCHSSTPTSPAPTSHAYTTFSPASVSTSQPAAGAAGGASSSDVGSGVSSSSGRNSVAIPPGNPVIQRYSELLEAGSLQQDEQQLVLVQELARLYDQICSYKSRMDEYHRATAEHQARRLKRLQELLAEDAAAEVAEEQRQQQQGRGLGAGAGGRNEPPATSIVSGLGSWLMSALGPLSGGGATGGAAAAADSPLARARAAAARREEVLRREIGPPPEAPEPPRGIYVWGSVGSGKSMLVSLFYQALMETAQLPASRWMHFNAAMLEVHSRLHHLDTERWRQRDERERAHSRHRQQQQQQQHAVRQQDGGGAELVRSGDADEYDEHDDEEEEDGQEAGSSRGTVSCRGAHALGSGAGGRGREGGGGGGTASKTAGEGEGDELLPVPEHLQGVFRHWDPKRDPEVLRQKEAKAAMLAVRRHMRLARLGRHDPRTLAAANAQGLVRMAASFIRGRAGDPRSGWGAAGGGGPIASVLYFDEVQVTDVFSAVALKGLVEALTSAGCVLVCTSNRSPLELPRHGLHEDMWGHFVDTLLQRCAVHELSSPSDYRRVLLEQGRASIAAAAAAAGSSGSSGSVSGAATAAPQLWPPLARSYILAAGPEGTAELERLWHARAMAEGGSAAAAAAAAGLAAAAADGERERALTLPVLFGRSLEVRRASSCGGAAWFSFGELCGRPLGPADYVALSQRFHTVFLEGVPAMSMQVRDQARRFITLLDELYNARCVLVASAEVPPEELFSSGGRGEGEGEAGWEPILDIEGLQFETAVEGARLRRDVTASGGVAPVASGPAALQAAMGALGGAEERFAFRRAVSRLLEMQSPQYINAALRLRQQQQRQQQQQQHAPQQQQQ